MKFRAFVTLFILATFSLCSQENPQFNNKTSLFDIDELFLLLPDSTLRVNLVQRIKTLKAKNVNELWSVYNGQYLLDTINLKNKYMFLRSQGDGGGDSFQLKSYSRDKKSDLIVLNSFSWGMSYSNGNMHFYEIDRDDVVEITGDIMPLISCYDFIPDSSVTSEIDTLINLSLTYHISQTSDTIKVELSETFFEELGEKITNNEWSEEKYNKMISKIEWKEINLVWRKEKYTIANKKAARVSH